MFLEQIPSFSLEQASFYWISFGGIFQVHLLQFIMLGQPSWPVLWLSAMLTIATTLSLISVFHIWLRYSLVRILMQRIATELYPHCCDQILPHESSLLKCLVLAFLFSYTQLWLLSSFPPRAHISKETASLLCSRWSLSLIEISSLNELFPLGLSLTNHW